MVIQGEEKMELKNQIKKHRVKANLSQDELADKVYVSRQTISNWENDKSYPDVKSLLLMSEVFQISLDQLIKGDLEKMKQEINKQDQLVFKQTSTRFTILFIAIVVLPVPLFFLLDWYGVAIYVFLFAISMYYALKVEKLKKQFNIQTYREIVAFSEGKNLNEIEKAREGGKRPYQKVSLVIASAVLTLIVSTIMILLIG